MKTYTFTAASFEGEVIFEFDDNGALVRYDASNARMSAEQQMFLLRKMPTNLADVKRTISSSPTAKLTEIVQDITFDQFWNRYDEKIRSSKKRAAKVWDRMSKTDRLKAFRFITKYEQTLYQGTAKKYAETYLNAELWNN